jgi:hypothetical protein
MIMNNDYIDDDKQMYHSQSQHFNSHGGVTMQYSSMSRASPEVGAALIKKIKKIVQN